MPELAINPGWAAVLGAVLAATAAIGAWRLGKATRFS